MPNVSEIRAAASVCIQLSVFLPETYLIGLFKF
jgi:hypothetical protein